MNTISSSAFNLEKDFVCPGVDMVTIFDGQNLVAFGLPLGVSKGKMVIYDTYYVGEIKLLSALLQKHFPHIEWEN